MGIAGLPRVRLDDAGSLGPARKVLVAQEILVEYVRVWWSLRRSGLRPTLEAIQRPPERDDPRHRAVGLRMGRAVNRTLGALPSDSRCLIRAVVLTRILARRGVGSRVVLGATREPDFKAHAWVEHCGVPLLPALGYARGRLTEL